MRAKLTWAPEVSTHRNVDVPLTNDLTKRPPNYYTFYLIGRLSVTTRGNLFSRVVDVGVSFPAGLSLESDDEISHLEWETVRVRFVKAGTVERLVEALATDDGELESTYVNVFLATYRIRAFSKMKSGHISFPGRCQFVVARKKDKPTNTLLMLVEIMAFNVEQGIVCGLTHT
ncbi:Ral guanine nucleotide dissociation stimulator-like 1 [Eumeta japonica]|uniref:Ral guanine nucleotide dissociation stimulator-like 1 n=1 Tax=Eumeta variegata TaxID=151549 RepID=A0A4C1XKR5_EUMVA|nr:Ral guanine nucleotide dissociation stimulator-like 1 [Eumeta japonica]